MKCMVPVLLMLLMAACGSGTATGPSTADNGLDAESLKFAPRNVGTQVWLAPAPAGDMLELGRHPELWPTAQRRIDVVALYILHAYHHPGFECGVPCGPNTYQNFLTAVPGGMYRWLSDRFTLAVEGPSIKGYSCTAEELLQAGIGPTNIAIRNIKTNGGRLTYLSLDEPFTAGLAKSGNPTFGCDLDVQQVAELQRQFNVAVHAEHPEVRIGLIEPYPHFTPEQIESFINALESVGEPVAYFHLDMDLGAVTRLNSDAVSDLRRLREFCRGRNIPFGVILWGGDGSSNEAFASGSMAMARVVAQAVGVTDHTLFQSWSEIDRRDQNSPKIYPDTVPEDVPFTHSNIVLSTLSLWGVEPTP